MNTKEEQLEAIRDMRNMMERSSRFLSLSGLAGVIVGLYAIIGIGVAYYILGITITDKGYFTLLSNKEGVIDCTYFYPLLIVSIIVLVLSLLTGSVLAVRNAKKKQLVVWDATSKRLLINMLIPLCTGAIFCLLLLRHGQLALVAPSTLIFYGLSLFTASRYTINDVRYLGILQIILGLIGAFFIDYGLILWALGFGLLHILYGFNIYIKYEK
jgi:predicted lysophospholipase L1 biosynthesis ABC-type transport system permease subunit